MYVENKKPPQGTKDNNYNGIGSWTFDSQEEALEFFNDLLQPEENNFPDEWDSVAKNGCVGLATLRAGWGGGSKPRNALFIPGSSWTTDWEVAQEELARLEKANPGKQYMIIAAQIPVIGDPARIAQKLGTGLNDDITGNRILNKSMDLDRASEFNFASWFPGDDGGYWEYMNHAWGRPENYTPGNCPRVEHQQSLPNLGKNFLTLYGIVPVRPFK